jgi:rubrerythrin
MNTTCVHSCKGLCAALEVAEHREQEAIREYRKFAGGCDYPDVRQILEELVRDREKALAVLREKREILTVKFNAIDRINDSFA